VVRVGATHTRSGASGASRVGGAQRAHDGRADARRAKLHNVQRGTPRACEPCRTSEDYRELASSFALRGTSKKFLHPTHCGCKWSREREHVTASAFPAGMCGCIWLLPARARVRSCGYTFPVSFIACASPSRARPCVVVSDVPASICRECNRKNFLCSEIAPFRARVPPSPLLNNCIPCYNVCQCPCTFGHVGKVTSLMYDFLTRAEAVRLAIVLAWWALCLLASVVAGAFAVGYVLTTVWNAPDALMVARLSCLALCVMAGFGSYWGMSDALHHGAWLSFRRSLFLRGKVGK